jgi:hypothetical protein
MSSNVLMYPSQVQAQANAAGFNTIQNNPSLLNNNNKVGQNFYNPGAPVPNMNQTGYPQTSSYTKQNYQNYYNNTHVVNNSTGNISYSGILFSK